MIQRCTNSKANRYKYYGGRGIKCFITKRQLQRLFIRDNAHLLKQASIHRIEDDKDYTFDNCKWIEFEENRKLAWEERKLQKSMVLKDLGQQIEFGIKILNTIKNNMV